MTGIILLPDWLITTPEELPRYGWGVRFVSDKITDVAPHQTLIRSYPQDVIQIATGQVLSPGFVNAHTHMYGVLAHGIPLSQAPSGFWAFLENFWWPLVEDQLTIEMICTATNLRCWDMLRSGVTSFYDCTEAPYTLPGVLAAQAEVVKNNGLRGILSFEATERVSSANGLLGLQENVNLIRSCREVATDEQGARKSLISGMMCFHTTFTCSAEFIKKAYHLAQENQVMIHMHVSEGNYEPEFCRNQYGLRPIQLYEKLGITDPRMIASQCVQIDNEEISIMKQCGVKMVHMPLSNCEVGGGIAPVPDLLEAGVTVGLGSDGYIEDFFEVMRGAFLIHKAARQDPRLMPAHKVWQMATEDGALALGLKKVGRIEPGWQADLQLIDVTTLPTPLEDYNLFEQLVLYRNASHVKSVWVAGNMLMQDGKVVGADFEERLAHTREAAKALWKKTGS